MEQTAIASESEAASQAHTIPCEGESRVRRRVAIFADPLLAPTLTFIPAQGSMLKRFEACYAGPQLGRAEGFRLAPDRTIVISSGRTLMSRLGELRFRLTGKSPDFFCRVRELSPALVHAHFGPGAMEAIELARWLGVPLIANFHGGDATIEPRHFLHSRHYMHRKFWRRRKALMREANLFLACSEFVQRELIRKGFPEDKIRVHYIGIDTHFFSPEPGVRREPIVLYVGSLAESKGILTLIRAMTEVQKRIPDARLVVLGDGPLRAEAERQAARQLRNCQFLGFQRAVVVREWMNRARAFCMPSQRAADGSCEGFGLVFIEAQAMALPVVSFASGGIPEAVEDGKTGILCEAGDVKALARNLIFVLEDETAWKRMSRAARAHVCERFDLRERTGILENIYDEVLSGMPAQASVAG
jgi:colanic acid/amylovoran biosynthesis glycosyltransferase